MRLEKGSVWRKWDLHLHTPSSFDYEDKSITDEQIIKKLVGAGIRLVAITDHHTIDVERITRLQQLGSGKITVLPGIELRSELGGSDTVHYIGIFPENCNLTYIWDKLRNELNLTAEDIQKKGGHDRVWVSIWKAAKSIHKYGGLVSIHAGKKSNSIEEISNKNLFQQTIKKDLLTKNVVDILEIGKVDDTKDYESIVFPSINDYLPLIICSDNHRITDYLLKENCWFRADPNFWGLRQAIVEPIDRIYIGEKPPKRISVAKNRTRYIQSISVKQTANSNLEEIWFDNIKIDLNHDLVSIIGNKGSGKSALAEVIGLLGNTHSRDSFSFLSPTRFRQPKNNLALHFEGEIHWANGITQTKNLNDNINLNAPEQIKCIPQGLFEEICNEVASGEDSKFNRELRKVIYSHVPEPDRLGKDSLDDLLEHLTDEIEDAIAILQSQLKEKNQQIADIEKRLTSGYREQLLNQLEEKKAELATHEKSKPETVSPPSTEDANKQASEQLNDLKANILKTEESIAEAREDISANAIKVSSAEKILEQLNNFESQYKEFKRQLISNLEEFGISFDTIVTLRIERKPIEEKATFYRDSRQKAENLINSSLDDGLSVKLVNLQDQLHTLQNKLDEPSRLYEAYQTELRTWGITRLALVGDAGKVGTVLYFEHQISELEELPKKLANAREERLKLVGEIYSKIQSLADVYKKLYTPVQDFSTKNDISKETFALQFDVSIVDQGFEQHFFDWVARNVVGSFYGSEEGHITLKKIIERYDFNNWEGVQAFLDDLHDHLEYDKRQSTSTPSRVEAQLRKGKELDAFYDFIYSLDYLRPRYILKLDDKELSQLSPGERGALLLIFYLLVDKASIPLIIDQPEENLDNQTVYQHLVNAIKQAKNRRQVIIVTHNPNLAVVCDSEQVICCSIDKKNGNKISYLTGSIENPEVNQHVIDILEGTKPAFTNRRRKYAPFQDTVIHDDQSNAA
ncbi:MAG: AAA family ATPase [Chloroflexota bacterium]